MSAMITQCDDRIEENTSSSSSFFTNLPDVNELLASQDLRGSFNDPFPEDFDIILKQIAVTGDICHSWLILKKIFALKIIQVLKIFFAEKGFLGPVEYTFEIKCDELLILLNKFDTDAPFTIQRLSEVITNPSSYLSTHKLMNCIEKLLSVTSTISARI